MTKKYKFLFNVRFTVLNLLSFFFPFFAFNTKIFYLNCMAHLETFAAFTIRFHSQSFIYIDIHFKQYKIDQNQSL